MSTHFCFRCSILSVLLSLLAGARLGAADGAPPQPLSSNGLTSLEKATWYHLSQGTEIFPLTFLLALKDLDTDRPFTENLERFGFLPDPKSATNPFGLPVGISTAVTRDLRFAGVRMIGLNCAACHTAQFEKDGKPVFRADGGTNRFDVNAFTSGLARHTRKTIANPEELIGFVRRLLEIELQNPNEGLPAVRLLTQGEGRLLKKFSSLKQLEGLDPFEKALAARLRKLIDKELDSRPLDLSRQLVTRADDPRLPEAKQQLKMDLAPDLKDVLALPPHPDNPLRLLGAATQRLETMGMATDLLQTLRLLRGRLALLTRAVPPGNATEAGFGRVDAFGSARNALFPDHPIELTAPVRFPLLWNIEQVAWYHWDANTLSRQERNIGEALGVGVILDPATFQSTVQWSNLEELEKLAARLTPPVWPAAVFGAIDTAKARQGGELFSKHCLACHAAPAAGQKILDKLIPLATLQTDPLRVNNIRRPVGTQGFFDAISPILKKTIAAAGGPPAGPGNLWRPSAANQPNLPPGHPNRPLRAIWASPPYLHNGSVPTLDDLLLPANQRPKSFRITGREYDGAKLGYRYVLDSSEDAFDTTIPGNFKDGHSGPAYGPEFTLEQRQALLEFLKTN
jgi:hypothetical protein